MNKTNRSKFLLIEKINTHSYMHKYYIGKVFDCARDAGKWVEFVKEIYYCNFDLIKQACKGKQKHLMATIGNL